MSILKNSPWDMISGIIGWSFHGREAAKEKKLEGVRANCKRIDRMARTLAIELGRIHASQESIDWANQVQTACEYIDEFAKGIKKQDKSASRWWSKIEEKFELIRGEALTLRRKWEAEVETQKMKKKRA